MKRIIFGILGSIGLVMLIGCGGEPLPKDLPKTYAVKITVTQDGSPLEGASVSLMPEDTSSRFSAGGITDASGVVIPQTLGMYSGVPAGQYKATITKTDRVEKASSKKMVRPAPPGAPPRSADAENLRKEYDHFNLVEAEYRDSKKTPLTVNVQTQSNAVALDAGKAVREKVAPRR